mmetsp:Transcript_57144/g.107773  ORF Transcript_57144/g.107773 Transcript_57144/m.107773 type:complete len:270 (+) Transcript_57144:1348-2157(+)
MFDEGCRQWLQPFKPKVGLINHVHAICQQTRGHVFKHFSDVPLWHLDDVDGTMSNVSLTHIHKLLESKGWRINGIVALTQDARLCWRLPHQGIVSATNAHDMEAAVLEVALLHICRPLKLEHRIVVHMKARSQKHSLSAMLESQADLPRTDAADRQGLPFQPVRSCYVHLLRICPLTASRKLSSLLQHPSSWLDKVYTPIVHQDAHEAGLDKLTNWVAVSWHRVVGAIAHLHDVIEVSIFRIRRTKLLVKIRTAVAECEDRAVTSDLCA